MDILIFVAVIVAVIAGLAYFGKLGSIGAKIKNLITAGLDMLKGMFKKD